MSNLATAADIVQYQHPMMAHLRELEARVRLLLDQQLRAEQEIRRLQAVAAQAEAEAKRLHAELACVPSLWTSRSEPTKSGSSCKQS